MDSSHDTAPGPAPLPDRDRQARQWAMLLHLSLFSGYIVPGAGFAVPVLIWQLKKAEYPELEPHGINVVNWLISCVIYIVVCVILTFVVIGVPLLFLLGILGIVFPIIGAIKANSGEVWKYPLTISILK